VFSSFAVDDIDAEFVRLASDFDGFFVMDPLGAVEVFKMFELDVFVEHGVAVTGLHPDLDLVSVF